MTQHFAASWEVIWSQMADDPATTEWACERTYELGLRGAAPDAEMIHAAQMVTVRLMQGRMPEFLEIVQRMASAFPELPVWRAALCIGLIITGSKQRGREIYEELAREDFTTLPRDMIWFTTLSLLGWGQGPPLRHRGVNRLPGLRPIHGVVLHERPFSPEPPRQAHPQNQQSKATRSTQATPLTC